MKKKRKNKKREKYNKKGERIGAVHRHIWYGMKEFPRDQTGSMDEKSLEMGVG